MKTVFRVALLTVGATLFYAYVGHMVPQKITYPPESVELSADMTTEQMVATGLPAAFWMTVGLTNSSSSPRS